MRLRTLLFFFALIAIAGPKVFAVHVEEIGVKPEELWPAIKQAMQPYGIRKEDPTKNQIETNWIYDRVKRRRGLLKTITSQVYERRYRLKVFLTEQKYNTKIVIQGSFQDKPYNDRPVQQSWSKVKPTAEDLEVERALFQKILTELEQGRRKAAGLA